MLPEDLQTALTACRAIVEEFMLSLLLQVGGIVGLDFRRPTESNRASAEWLCRQSLSCMAYSTGGHRGSARYARRGTAMLKHWPLVVQTCARLSQLDSRKRSSLDDACGRAVVLVNGRFYRTPRDTASQTPRPSCHSRSAGRHAKRFDAVDSEM